MTRKDARNLAAERRCPPLYVKWARQQVERVKAKMQEQAS